jgi:ketosteroid isomerase-like protein
MPTIKELMANFPDVAEHFADDIEWHLPVSLWEGVGGSHYGREAVDKMFAKVMSEFYKPETISLDRITAFGTDTQATLVFVVNATTQWGQAYRNNYMVTFEIEDGKIARVYEIFDTKHLFDTLDTTALGISPDAAPVSNS